MLNFLNFSTQEFFFAAHARLSAVFFPVSHQPPAVVCCTVHNDITERSMYLTSSIQGISQILFSSFDTGEQYFPVLSAPADMTSELASLFWQLGRLTRRNAAPQYQTTKTVFVRSPIYYYSNYNRIGLSIYVNFSLGK